ncbi:MAG: zf-HC2 domain-containing protein [Thermomicrobiales bacterium]|nr:zf-HC2 domain-containing protein [Thermomicrobiales bacterium]
MISHDRAQELVSARMDAPLTPAEHRELQNHLAECPSCRAFVAQADDLARGLQTMSHLGPSPVVSRAVMDAISSDTSGWSWLRQALQALSSPGMAVASSMALVLALAGALIVALNAPGRGPAMRQGPAPEGTIAAVALAPLPTEPPTRIAEPTATKPPVREIAPPPTKTPAMRPTATAVPIVAVTAVPTIEPVVDSPAIQPVEDVPVANPEQDVPMLAMADDGAGTSNGSVDLAQQATVDEAQPAEAAPVDDGADNAVADAPVQDEGAAAAPAGDTTQTTEASDAAPADNGGRKTARKGDSGDQAPAEVATEPVGPVDPASAINPLTAEAIAALEGNGLAPGVSLPPAPMDPMPPAQPFLPVTPTPEPDGTPTPEGEPETQADAPQLAIDTSGDLGVTALAPDPDPGQAVIDQQAPEAMTTDSETVKAKERRDKSSKAGRSRESQQAAFVQEPYEWTGNDSLALQQTADGAAEPAEGVVDANDGAGETTEAAAAPDETGETSATDGPSEEPAPQIDPATGMEIDPATGLLIDPTTGFLLDPVHNRVIDPRTHYVVNPRTGLLIDPATGDQLDPVTLQVVIPAGFGSDQPRYEPGSPEMRGEIESVVNDTYNNASIKIEPPTDGPVQPVGEIVVPTESGDAVEIS